MSLSTSSSKKKKRWRIVAFLLLLFMGLEVFTRTKLLRMSKDFARFEGYPQRVKTLMGQEGVRLAFVGNSATEKGVQLQTLTEEMRTKGVAPFHTDMFTADASHAPTWYYMLNHYFWRPHLTPDLTVISYYERNLEDGTSEEIGRLALYFTRREDWGEAFRHDFTDRPTQLEFVLSSQWATYAARNRLKERTLSALVPGYKDYIQQVNEVAYKHNKKAAEAHPAAKTVSHETLKRILAHAKQRRMKLCFIAFPTRPLPERALPYDLNPETVRLIREAGMEHLDMRETPGLTTDRFADDIHLTPEGAALYTRHLAAQMEPILKRIRLAKTPSEGLGIRD